MDERDELLRRSWEGEILGRSLFTHLITLLPDDRDLWELLARLEATVGAMVAPVARAHGLEIDEPSVERSGAELATAVRAGGRQPLLTSALDVVGEYVPLYERLRELLPDDERWLGDELVAHERAFESALRDALEGRAAPGTDVVAFLARHGVTVAG